MQLVYISLYLYFSEVEKSMKISQDTTVDGYGSFLGFSPEL